MYDIKRPPKGEILYMFEGDVHSPKRPIPFLNMEMFGAKLAYLIRKRIVDKLRVFCLVNPPHLLAELKRTCWK